MLEHKPLATKFAAADLFITENLGADLANKCVIRNVFISEDWDDNGQRTQMFSIDVHWNPLFPNNPLEGFRLESEEFTRAELEVPGPKVVSFREKVDSAVTEFLKRAKG